MKKYHLMGSCHVDLAWHGDEEQYANYLEQFTVILLDMLEQYPDMTYLIEQAYHYRKLKERRPDLIERLKKYIAEGRIEVVGGMISTADSNMPCGESLIRNQLLGLRWFEREMNAKIKTAWLVDAFGSHAQIPQILKSFGMKQLLSSRFGGDKHYDYFLSEGLDGTQLLTAGRDAHSHNLPTPDRTRFFFYWVNDGAGVDGMFDKIYKAELDGPLLVNVYIEDETYPTRRVMTRFRELQEFARKNGDEAVFTLTGDFFDALKELKEDLPVESADLNPEFTGTYAQRVEIKLHNRRTENALLEAERQLALHGIKYGQRFDDCWWDLGFVHFHDVFTGSHPESVFLSVMDRLDRAKLLAENAVDEIYGSRRITDSTTALRIVNSLPYARREWVSVPLQKNCIVRNSRGVVLSYHTGDKLWFAAEADGCSSCIYTLEPALAADDSVNISENVLENEYLIFTVDQKNGITLTEKNSGRKLLDRAKDILIMQGDTGNFQIEQLENNEQHAWSAPVCIDRIDNYRITAEGTFVNTRSGIEEASWKITFTLHPGEPMIGMSIHVNWQAVGKRIRVKLSSTLTRAGEGLYEIPFGVIHRRPYTPGFSHKGEWPAQRFVTVEDGECGIALFNTGVPGAEILGGTIYTTLLRAPVQTYSFMVPDHSSQQHGEHDFDFGIFAYTGSWNENDLIRRGQRMNTPLGIYAAEDGVCDEASLLSIDNPNIILSAVKEVIDDDSAILVRISEGCGKAQTCRLKLPGAVSAYSSDMLEQKLDEIPVADGVIELSFAPWQIRSIYIEKESGK